MYIDIMSDRNKTIKSKFGEINFEKIPSFDNSNSQQYGQINSNNSLIEKKINFKSSNNNIGNEYKVKDSSPLKENQKNYHEHELSSNNKLEIKQDMIGTMNNPNFTPAEYNHANVFENKAKQNKFTDNEYERKADNYESDKKVYNERVLDNRIENYDSEVQNNNVNHFYYNPRQVSNVNSKNSGNSSFSGSKKNSFSNRQKEKIQINFGLQYNSAQQHLPDNSISTTKYSLWSFLPKSLLYQFKRAANIYFLVISILTCFEFSPKQPSSMIGTFAFVLIATMIKEFFEDYNRYKQDRASNERLITKLTPDGWKKVQCMTLHSGEIVKVFKEEEFSADCVIIHTSNSNGYLYIDTKNLDGESNLKEKSAVEEYANITNFENFFGKIKCEKSNDNLFQFEGVINAQEHENISTQKLTNKLGSSPDDINTKALFISMRNMILKGCTLKNTDYCIGIVIYTGASTKIMKNSKAPRIKVSKILKIMNILLYSLFAFTVCICVALAGSSLNFKKNSISDRVYIYDKNVSTVSEQNDALYYFVRVLIFFVAYSNIIPISLYVGLEVVKLFQGLLIYYDSDMYDVETEMAAKCRATDLIEELGQVDFIFSDKTGTLTQNVMLLKRCYCAEEIFGIDPEESQKLRSSQLKNKSNVNNSNLRAELKYSINGDMNAYNILRDPQTAEDKKERINSFFTILSLCHSVFPEITDMGITYQGASPDDIALVQGAAQLGYVFASKDFHEISISNEIYEKTKKYELLVEMPFDSDRKRMSVLVRDMETGVIKLLSKGADTVMNKRIDWRLTSVEEHSLSQEIMDVFCKEGLRCLVLAEREISENEYKAWKDEYNYAISKGRELTRYFDDLEQSMLFVGVTAIEDKLQDGVGATIYSLTSCGIRLWVLTGDKQDTAVEIAKGCKLIRDDTKLIFITSPEAVETIIKNMIVELEFNTEEFLGEDFISRLEAESSSDGTLYFMNDEMKIKRNIDLMALRNHLKNKQGGFDTALVVDGFSLDVILNSYCLSAAFFYIASACMSVVCCRVSPKQKSNVVKLAKTFGDWVTLSIGDGANDVPMIMEANIGVGIQGKEGTQAVRSSDFSISQFRFLNKLLLDYGRNGYIKISKFICYYFYKNILLALTEFYFALYNGYSGQIFFADYLNTMYNAFFTSWPCVAFIFEKEHNVDLVKRFPILYQAGQLNKYFNIRVFWTYVFYSIIHSAGCFFIPFYCLKGIMNNSGYEYDLWYISTVSFSIVIHISTLKILVMSNYWNGVIFFTTIGSLVFYYVTLFVLCNNTFSLMFQPEILGIASNIVKHSKTLMILVLCPVIILMTDYLMKMVVFAVSPNPSEYITQSLINKKIPIETSTNNEIDDQNSHFVNASSRLSRIFLNQKSRNTISMNKTYISQNKLASSSKASNNRTLANRFNNSSMRNNSNIDVNANINNDGGRRINNNPQVINNEAVIRNNINVNNLNNNYNSNYLVLSSNNNNSSVVQRRTSAAQQNSAKKESFNHRVQNDFNSTDKVKNLQKLSVNSFDKKEPSMLDSKIQVKSQYNSISQSKKEEASRIPDAIPLVVTNYAVSEYNEMISPYQIQSSEKEKCNSGYMDESAKDYNTQNLKNSVFEGVSSHKEVCEYYGVNPSLEVNKVEQLSNNSFNSSKEKNSKSNKVNQYTHEEEQRDTKQKIETQLIPKPEDKSIKLNYSRSSSINKNEESNQNLLFENTIQKESNSKSIFDA